jgi:phosphoenolpyruvate carboxykinase (GTP)
MAMLPFIGYHAGDYFQHWLNVGKQSDESKLPKVFFVNWFRRSAEGTFLWPGYGENSRVLEWIVGRIEGTTDASETPIGLVPTAEALDTAGLGLTPQALEAVLRADPEEWAAEIPLIEEWFAKIGDKVPGALLTELDGLKARLGLT